MTKDAKTENASAPQIASFLTWAREQHGLMLGRMHVHESRCYAHGRKEPVCGYVSGSFEPLCVPAGSLASLFVDQESITGPRQSVLLELVMDGRRAESGLRRIPTEQDVLRALNAWQPHPALTSQESGCVPGTCFCCDAARELALNTPFMAAVHSIVEQLAAGETGPLDALTSAFAFGVLTAQFMQKQVQ